MENEDKKVVVEGEEKTENGEEKIETTEFVEPSGKARKIIKIVLTGLAAVATGVVGFLIGRSTAKDDDDEETETKEEAA